MKRFRWLYTLGGLIALYVVCAFFGILRIHHIPTGANEPNINEGDWIVVTRLAAPKRLDFICYRQDAVEGMKGSTWVMRLCGMPGDTVKMIDGILFVNGRNVDSSLNIKMAYVVPRYLGFVNRRYYRGTVCGIY